MPRFSECWRCGQTPATVVCRSCNVAKYCSDKCKEDDVARHKDAECRPVSVIQTCLSCRRTGSSLQTCTGCYRAVYCDSKCQENHRQEHKNDCKGILRKIKSLSESIDKHLPPNFGSICGAHYYWGNVPAYDYLNLSENEGVDYSSALNLLVLGVGDLRNIVLTCASLPDGFTKDVLFTLNDSDSYVLARLILLLYMMIKCDPSSSSVITEIWYSTLLSEKTYNYLCASLKGLICMKSSKELNAATDGVVSLQGKHLKEFQKVWRRWIELKVEGTSKIRKQRNEKMIEDSGSFLGRINYYSCIPPEHLESAKKYMENGVFQRTERCSFAENPTLTGPSFFAMDDSYTYCCLTSILPFVGWDYIEVKKFGHSGSLITMYGNYIDCKMASVMEKLTSKKIKFKIVLGHCMYIEEFLHKEVKYDRILTSNLMDYILLPELLRTYSGKLNRDNPYAALITETLNWIEFCPDADVSMIPSSTSEQTEYLRRIVMQDTKNPVLAQNGGTTFREYLDNSPDFQDYIRAVFHLYNKRYNRTHSSSSKLPNLKGLGKEFQLRLRDGQRNENRIVFFKYAVNRRRVTMINGLERYMEWEAV